MLCCLMTAFKRTGRCDGQMGGLTELNALLVVQTFVECQPKLLKHRNRPLLNISHRENNYIHSKKYILFLVKMQRQRNDVQTLVNQIL